MRQLGAGLTQEKNLLESTGEWLELFEVTVNDLGDVLRLVHLNENVTFRGNVYYRAGLARSDLVEDSESRVPTLTVTIANATLEVQRQLDASDGLVGRRARHLLVHRNHLAGGEAALEMDYIVDDAEGTEQTASLVLSQINPQMEPALNRFVRNRCRWRYKGLECAYQGSLGTCDKTLLGTNGCKVHGDNEVAAGQPRLHPARFGGFPGIRAQ